MSNSKQKSQNDMMKEIKPEQKRKEKTPTPLQSRNLASKNLKNSKRFDTASQPHPDIQKTGPAINFENQKKEEIKKTELEKKFNSEQTQFPKPNKSIIEEKESLDHNSKENQLFIERDQSEQEAHDKLSELDILIKDKQQSLEQLSIQNELLIEKNKDLCTKELLIEENESLKQNLLSKELEIKSLHEYYKYQPDPKNDSDTQTPENTKLLIKQLTDLNCSHVTEIQNLKSELEGMQGTIKAIKSENSRLKQQISDFVKDKLKPRTGDALDELQNKNSELNYRLKDSEKQKSEICTSLIKKNEEIEELKKKLIEIEKKDIKINQFERIIEEFQNNPKIANIKKKVEIVQENSAKLVERDRKVNELELENNRLKREISYGYRDEVGVKKLLDDLTQENIRLRGIISSREIFR